MEHFDGGDENMGNGGGPDDVSADRQDPDGIEKIRKLASNLIQAINHATITGELSPEAVEETLDAFRKGFYDNHSFHEKCEWKRLKHKTPEAIWPDMELALRTDPAAIWSIRQMTLGGHEPNVYMLYNVGFGFCTYAKESPASGWNCVYDEQAGKDLKSKKPEATFRGNAVQMASNMGLRLMSPHIYHEVLQDLGRFDTCTTSWLATTDELRGEGFAPLGILSGKRVSNVERHCPRRGWRGYKWVYWPSYRKS